MEAFIYQLGALVFAVGVAAGCLALVDAIEEAKK